MIVGILIRTMEDVNKAREARGVIQYKAQYSTNLRDDIDKWICFRFKRQPTSEKSNNNIESHLSNCPRIMISLLRHLGRTNVTQRLVPS